MYEAVSLSPKVTVSVGCQRDEDPTRVLLLAYFSTGETTTVIFMFTEELPLCRYWAFFQSIFKLCIESPQCRYCSSLDLPLRTL